MPETQPDNDSVLIWSARSPASLARTALLLGMLASLAPVSPGRSAERAAPSGPEAQETSERSLDELVAALEAAQAELIEGLEELVGWCTEERLFASREALSVWMLNLDPANEVAHLALLHKLDANGVWVPPKKRSPVKDYTRSQVPEFARRRAEVGARFADRLVNLAGAAPEAPGSPPFLPLVMALERGLELAPDHGGLRGLRGEARVGDEWVLLETARAKDRRGELEELVRAAYAGVPEPVPVEPDAHEAATGVDWKVKLATPKVRVLSTGGADEALAMARAAHATIDAFNSIFGTETELGSTFAVYILNSETDRVAFVSGWYTWGADQVEPTQAFVGAGVPLTQSTARWDPDPKTRLDGAIRHTVGELLRAEFKLDMTDAWAWEGLGLYLTRELVGTRRTFYGSIDGLDASAKALISKLVTVDDVNWINEAFTLMGEGKATPVERLLETRIDAVGVYDLLGCYALAAYLIEGQPERLPELLRATADSRETAATAFGTVLGQTPAATEARLFRWLTERR